MSRGRVDKKTAAAIAAKLPDLQSVQQLVLTMSPDFISTRFAHDSTVPQASVCLNDAMAALGEASYATFEAEAHLIWYRQLSKRAQTNRQRSSLVVFTLATWHCASMLLEITWQAASLICSRSLTLSLRRLGRSE